VLIFAVTILPDTPLKVVFEGEDEGFSMIPQNLFLDDVSYRTPARRKGIGIPLPKFREIKDIIVTKFATGNSSPIRLSERISERGPISFRPQKSGKGKLSSSYIDSSDSEY